MKTLMLLAMLLGCGGACAAEAVAIDESNACVEADRGIQQGLNLCETLKLEKDEQELEAVLAQIRQSYADEPLFLARLDVSQKLWAQSRDADLAARFPVEDGDNPTVTWGSSYGMSVARFLADRTRARTAYLQLWLDGAEEGDFDAGSIHRKTGP